MIHDRTGILIKTEGLGKLCGSNSTKEAAVNSLSISICQGEMVVIRGISGTHRSAFFNLLGCLQRPDSGKYYFDYEDIALASDEVLEDIRRKKIGYLFRDYRLIDRLSVVRNVEVPMFGMDIDQEEVTRRASDAIAAAGVEAIAAAPAGGLSDYQRQLVAYARAIVNTPLMILADDPVLNLNPEEAGLLMEKLLRLNAEGTSVLIFDSGNIDFLLGSHRVITFEKGSLVSDIQVNKPFAVEDSHEK